jgi:glycosyltransferase involved in cell wall biosynthesis
MTDSLPLVTAVICTHNREAYLDACIQSALNQTLPSDQYEVLVVDNASTDRTRAISGSYADIPNFRYVYEEKVGLSHARNRGIAEARAPYVGFLDDDAQALENWLSGVVSAFQEPSPQPAWVGGPIELRWHAPAPGWMDAELRVALGEVALGPEPRFLRPGERLGGGNSFFRKDVLMEVGGFDIRLGRQKGTLLSGEETALQHILQSRGERLYYHPDIHILHDAHPDRIHPRWFYKRYYWGGKSDKVMAMALRGLEHPDLVLEKAEGSRWVRLTRNLTHAVVHPDRGKRIRARVYLSYVAGRLL